jgi:hypothetical protein
MTYISEDAIKKIFSDLCLFDYKENLFEIFKQVTKDANSLQAKADIYLNVWKNTLGYLYRKYLPYKKIDDINVSFEYTPYTFFLVSTFPANLKKEFNLSSKDNKYINEIFFEFKMNSKSSFDEKIDIVNFVLGIMLFPPLMQLKKFYENAYKECSQNAKALFETVVNVEKFDVYPFKTNAALHFASRFFSQDTYKNLGGIEGLINLSCLSEIAGQLELIKNECPDRIVGHSNAICPDCGSKADAISIEKNDICYVHILESHPEIHKYIGFQCYDYYKKDISKSIRSIFENSTKSLNEVRNSKCLILVEGATEEIAIPSMALKYQKPLISQKIHVMNCRSKEKLLADFKKMAENFPEKSICALIDSDAKKEKAELDKLIQRKKNRFCYKYIPKGAFEDLIPIDVALKSLNEIYPMNKTIEVSEIDEEKEFVPQIERLLWERSKSKFDKVKFIKKVISIMKPEDIPSLIKELIDDAYKLSAYTK